MQSDRIGPYRILHTLGAGGMGEVFLAERADAEFEQRVAIKVVHAGTASRGIHSRLKIERQILAQLDHPNIAHLMDGGTLSDGTAYIVIRIVWMWRRGCDCFKSSVPRCITRTKISSCTAI